MGTLSSVGSADGRGSLRMLFVNALRRLVVALNGVMLIELEVRADGAKQNKKTSALSYGDGRKLNRAHVGLDEQGRIIQDCADDIQ